MATTYSLSGHLDSAAAPLLATDLLQHRGRPICIDASAVTFAGALCVQVLLAARKQWQEDENGFQVSPLGEGLARAASGLGVALAAIGANEMGTAVVEADA